MASHHLLPEERPVRLTGSSFSRRPRPFDYTWETCFTVKSFLNNAKNKRILGINPPVYDFAWFDLWAKPAGLLGVLQLLRERGCRVSLLDCLYEARAEPLSFGRWRVVDEERPKPAAYGKIPRRYRRFGLGGDALRERLAREPRPDAVLVASVMTYWYSGVFEAIRAAKEVFPDVPAILGGVYATLCPGHAATSGADVVASSPCVERAGTIALDLYGDPGCAVLATSYGCPMRCGYCASRLLSPSFRQRPLEEVCADLRAQLSSGAIRDVVFYDDALLWDRENHFYPLCAHIREHHPGLRLHAPNGLHVAALDERCCEELYATGFHTIRLSLEGVDAGTAAASSEKTGPADYARAVRNLLRAGYAPERIETYILAGLPGQRIADVEASVDYVKSLGARPKIAEFSPIPGTPLFAEAAKATPEIAHEPLLHNNTVYVPYVSKAIGPEELQGLKDRARG